MTQQPIWQPSATRVSRTRLTAFEELVREREGRTFADYGALHAWSIADREAFWQCVWDYCGILASATCEHVLTEGDDFARARWFAGSRLNFAENLLRFSDDRVALVSWLENGEREVLTYAELAGEVARLAGAMRAAGVKAGDRVAGFMPNIIPTVVAMLASSSIGAVWSSCSPDFGINGVCDRFGQIEPRLLFVADGYYYGGKQIDCLERVAAIQAEIPTIERTVVVPLVHADPDLGALANASLYDAFVTGAAQAAPEFEQLPFDHPLYIMYSSGTTGVPKCIVHGAGGTLIQHLKEHQLHTDLKRDDVLFYFTTCGWMMWNWLVSGLASGCTVMLYDGSPFAEEGRILMEAIDAEGITVFGTSAKYLAALEKRGIRPRESHHLGSLRTILSTGSPLSAESFDYVYRDVKKEVALCSISGGTDLISCFVLGNPNLPVFRGEIQCSGLGMAVDVWDASGAPLRGAKGELVCTLPFPSVPIRFWNDPDGSKFRGAYFEQFPGVWAHGDYGEITANGGMIIHGRSDAVLNPGGVRIGTAEIYRQVERVDAVIDSIVVGQDWEGDVRVVLFVVLREGMTLDAALIDEIKRTIRQHATPRHVPAIVLQVEDIPRTISGKIVELAVRNVIHDRPVNNTDALANPEALDYFRNRAELER